MARHLQNEFDLLRKAILSLCAYVEESLELAVEAIGRRDASIAKRVIEMDSRIDSREVEIEEECLKVLALHQPVALDLRYIVAVLKINSDLERIGDLAVNIAERAIGLSTQAPAETSFDFLQMAHKVQRMVHLSIDALVDMDTTRAHQVLEADDEVDHIHRQMYQQIQSGIKANPARVDFYIQLLAVSRNLERVGDHATNIAEDVIYLVAGDIVRHRKLPMNDTNK